MNNYKALLPYCVTQRQTEVINALIKHKGVTSKAAKEVGISSPGVRDAIEKVKFRSKK